MVQLVDSDIRTREVLGWQGVHVLHFVGSSCSQKLRIFLNLKKIPWQSHPIDLPSNENMQPWFLGINPRGLVPVLVHDGAVHIESNDIIQYLEERFPTPRLIPAGHEKVVAALLKHEDDLHLDLRTLSFRFVFAPPGPPKPAAALESYIVNGSGTVQGAKDREKQVQIEFWQRAAREGFTDAQARASAFEVPCRVRRARQNTREAALSDGRPLERARHRVADLRAPALACRLSVRTAASTCPCLGRETSRYAGVCQGGHAASPFRRTGRQDTARTSWKNVSNNCGILARSTLAFAGKAICCAAAILRARVGTAREILSRAQRLEGRAFARRHSRRRTCSPSRAVRRLVRHAGWPRTGTTCAARPRRSRSRSGWCWRRRSAHRKGRGSRACSPQVACCPRAARQACPKA